MLELFRADDGSDPIPALDLHLRLARDYGRDMRALQLTPQAVVDRSMVSDQPLWTFLQCLDTVGGYKEDPLRKKSSLLAMIINDRPEHFLQLEDDELIPPVIDYHAMRSALRIGLIDVVGEELHRRLSDRQLLTTEEEWAVRWAVYRAFEMLAPLSGKSTCAVDQFVFHNARRRCLEMTEPLCPECPLDGLCAKRKGLFQPVRRTTDY
jgi:hypothetical protein